MAAETNYTTSIILVTWNRLELTKRMMESFWKTTDTPYHLFIIDNGSKDGTVEWLQQLKPGSEHCQGLETHFFEINRGLATGRNKGMLIAQKYNDPYFATVDNDIELPQSWLRKAIDVMEANPMFSIGVNFEEVKYPLLTKNGQTFQFKPKGNAGGAGCIFSRALHEKIGYFTVDYALYGEEDANIGMRTRLAGYGIGYINDDTAVHFGVSELDSGEYREFKDQCRKENLPKFQKDCHDYINKKQSIYIPYCEKP